MKEKTKAFYKAVFKFWVKNTLAPFAITLVLMFIIGFVSYALGSDMGYTALFLLTWKEVKEALEEKKSEKEKDKINHT